MEKFGFIGMGNMAQAIAKGWIDSKTLSPDKIYAYAPNTEKLKRNAEKIGFIAVEDIISLVDQCDTLIVSCKPYQIESVLEKIGSLLEGKTLLSIAAGWDHAKYRAYLPKTRIQFVMPNTPAMVSEGVFLFEETCSLTDEERSLAMELFSALGIVEILPSNLMGIGGAISGCGPAFVDMMIEAYADAAVKYGIPRSTAYRLVSATIAGSASLQIKTGEHPARLKDNVCSPAGTTIRGVATLEEKGFRSACISSIDAIMNFKK